MIHRVLVVGATGAQGGSVARHLMASGRYQVRCLTRDPASSRAMAIGRSGAEVVRGDLSDAPSLLAALRDCDAVFGVTNFWEHHDREYQQGRQLVDAIAQSHIQHAVLSSLPNSQVLSGGRMTVPHFDTKARMEEYARSRGIPATYIHVAFYYENFLDHFPPQRTPGGTYAFGFPQGMTPLAAVAADDIGGVVAAILSETYWYRDKTIGVVGDEQRCDVYAETMSRVTGRKIVYQHVPPDKFAALGFPGARELAHMFEFNRQYVTNRKADLAKTREIYPAVRDFEHWLRDNSTAFDRILSAPVRSAAGS